jgi:putative Mn2+ efflux pump MntP
MEFFGILMISVGLAMDCFAVALGIGTANVANTRRQKFRIAFHAGIFQGGMTLLGWLAGSTVASLIGSVDHWIALALLLFVGVRMIRAGLDKHGASYTSDPSRGMTLIILSVATSIDAAAVGLSFALLSVDILGASLLIGLISLALSLVGSFAGNRLGARFGKRMEIVGGLLLVAIGVRILITHLG